MQVWAGSAVLKQSFFSIFFFDGVVSCFLSDRSVTVSVFWYPIFWVIFSSRFHWTTLNETARLQICVRVAPPHPNYAPDVLGQSGSSGYSLGIDDNSGHFCVYCNYFIRGWTVEETFQHIILGLPLDRSKTLAEWQVPRPICCTHSVDTSNGMYRFFYTLRKAVWKGAKGGKRPCLFEKLMKLVSGLFIRLCFRQLRVNILSPSLSLSCSLQKIGLQQEQTLPRLANTHCWFKPLSLEGCLVSAPPCGASNLYFLCGRKLKTETLKISGWTCYFNLWQGGRCGSFLFAGTGTISGCMECQWSPDKTLKSVKRSV